MLTINHALWGAVIGRTVGMPIEGALLAASPDLIALPYSTYYALRHKRQPLESEAAHWIMFCNNLLHNWFFALILSIGLYLVSYQWAIVGLGYLLHVVQDAFVHKRMATQFLYPLWKGKVQRISATAEGKWLNLLDAIVIIVVFYLTQGIAL